MLAANYSYRVRIHQGRKVLISCKLRIVNSIEFKLFPRKRIHWNLFYADTILLPKYKCTHL